MSPHRPPPRRGATLTEYILLIVLASIALISSIAFFGTEVVHDFGGIAARELEEIAR